MLDERSQPWEVGVRVGFCQDDQGTDRCEVGQVLGCESMDPGSKAIANDLAHLLVRASRNALEERLQQSVRNTPHESSGIIVAPTPPGSIKGHLSDYRWSDVQVPAGHRNKSRCVVQPACGIPNLVWTEVSQAAQLIKF